MSKAHDPHWRYVALRLSGTGCSRSALGSAVKNAAKHAGVEGDLPQLTRFEWPHAIVKMHHHQLPGSRDWLPGLRAPGVEGATTLSSSGTIKALTTRLGVLDERGPKGGKDKPAPRGARSAAGPTAPPGGPARPPGRVRRRDHRD